MKKSFKNLNEFYQYYLAEHSHRICRRFHFVGTTLGIVFFAIALVTQNFMFLFAALISGYSFAWVGHFFYEKNRPATFKYPIYSFICDFKMYKDILCKNISC